MRYRSFPGLPGLEVSTLGFGCRRLPTLEGDPARIDEPAATRLLCEALDAGVNYVDTAWNYHQGQAEPFLGRALRGGGRDRVRLATKLPVWEVATEGDWARLLGEQLGRLATDHLDFYLLHGLTRERWGLVQRLRGMEALERARADGRVAHLGFSFQGPLGDFQAILDGHDWAFCQLSLDLLDPASDGVAALRLASARGVGVVVMEPLRGGLLASVPAVVQEAWAASARPWSPAEWALRWVWDQAGVVTALSGMRSSGHLLENVGAAAGAGPLTEQDLASIEAVRRTYRTRRRVPCLACGGCGVCSNKLPVPDLFSLYNDAMLDSKAAAVEEYREAFQAQGRGADECDACGVCEPMCPRGIPIPQRLREVHEYLTRP